MGSATDGVNTTLFYREKESDSLEEILTTDFREDVDPLLFTSDNRSFYVASNRNRDKKAIFEFDLQKKAEGDLVFEHPEVDCETLFFSRKRKRITHAKYTTWKSERRFFDAVMARHQRWMAPQAHREGAREWVFLRFYDFEPDDSLTFNIVTLRRDGADAWSQRVASARLRPLMRDELTVALEKAHFDEITCWGDLQGTSFDPSCSPNLVVTARRAD